MLSKTVAVVLCALGPLLVGCGPGEEEKKVDAKEFMKSLDEDCERCGKVRIDLFGGEAK